MLREPTAVLAHHQRLEGSIELSLEPQELFRFTVVVN
jgi:hypothetical protein